MDNPGWSVSINLLETELEEKIFLRYRIDRSEDDWVICSKKDLKFEGRCGVNNLPEVLKIFRSWVESNQ